MSNFFPVDFTAIETGKLPSRCWFAAATHVSHHGGILNHTVLKLIWRATAGHLLAIKWLWCGVASLFSKFDSKWITELQNLVQSWTLSNLQKILVHLPIFHSHFDPKHQTGNVAFKLQMHVWEKHPMLGTCRFSLVASTRLLWTWL